MRRIEAHYLAVNNLIESNKNSLLISSSYDKSIKLWNKDTGQLIKTLLGNAWTISALIELRNGQLASGWLDSSIKIWDQDSGQLTKTITDESNAYVLSLAELNHPDYLASCTFKVIKIWNLTSNKLIRRLEAHSNDVRSMVMLKSGLLASASNDKTINIWDTRF